MHHDQEVRYSRHISLSEIGLDGQARLLESRVLVIGAGGLGSAALLYLAAAGVGTLGVIDDDRVALSNLQRQVIYETGDIGQSKVEATAHALHDRNPDVQINTHAIRADESNLPQLLEGYDLLIDASDNFETRFLANRCALAAKKPLVFAAVQGFSAQLTTFKPYLDESQPCYRCLFSSISDQAAPDCSTSGVLGSLVGVVGAWQASEAIKELLGIGTSLAGQLMLIDLLDNRIRTLPIERDPDCPECGS